MSTNSNETVQMALRQQCPHCNQDTLRFYSEDGCHCINPACNGFMLSMDFSQFITMTPEKLATYANCKQSLASQDDAQAEFERRLAEITAAAEKRAACRAQGIKVYG